MRTPLILSAAAIALALGACQATQMTATEQEVRENLAVEKWQPAPRQLRDSIETQDLLAQASFWSREYQLNPADLESAIKLAAVVRKMGNPGRAVEITQTTRALHPKDPYLIAEYAAALIATEQGAEALPVIEEGLAAASGYARLWSLRGAALDQAERYADARASYQRALSITPYDPNILANMGLSFALEGDAATAEKWLTQAASLPTASESVKSNLELVRQLRGPQTASAPAPAHVAPRPASRPPVLRTAPQAMQQGLAGQPEARLRTFQPGEARSASDALRQAVGQRPGGQRTVTAPAPIRASDPDALARLARNASPHTRGPQAVQAVPQQARSPFAPSAGQPPAPSQAIPAQAIPQGYPQAFPPGTQPYAQPVPQTAPQAAPQAAPRQPMPRGPLRLRR